MGQGKKKKKNKQQDATESAPTADGPVPLGTKVQYVGVGFVLGVVAAPTVRKWIERTRPEVDKVLERLTTRAEKLVENAGDWMASARDGVVAGDGARRDKDPPGTGIPTDGPRLVNCRWPGVTRPARPVARLTALQLRCINAGHERPPRQTPRHGPLRLPRRWRSCAFPNAYSPQRQGVLTVLEDSRDGTPTRDRLARERRAPSRMGARTLAARLCLAPMVRAGAIVLGLTMASPSARAQGDALPAPAPPAPAPPAPAPAAPPPASTVPPTALLPVAPATASATLAPNDAPTARHAVDLGKTPAYVVGGLAVATLVVGVVFASLSVRDHQQFVQHPTAASANSGDSHELTADMCFGAGATLAVAAVVMFFTHEAPEPDSAPATPHVSWSPMAGPHTAGAAASVSF